jgi:hypothetical protein
VAAVPSSLLRSRQPNLRPTSNQSGLRQQKKPRGSQYETLSRSRPRGRPRAVDSLLFGCVLSQRHRFMSSKVGPSPHLPLLDSGTFRNGHFRIAKSAKFEKTSVERPWQSRPNAARVNIKLFEQCVRLHNAADCRKTTSIRAGQRRLYDSRVLHEGASLLPMTSH